MNLEEGIQDFPIDIFDIEVSNKTESHKGKGYLYLSENGFIELKLFVDSPKENSLETFVESMNKTNANLGKIVPEEDYFTFRGIATNNDIYSCSRIYQKHHDNFKVYIFKITSQLIISNSTNKSWKIAKVEIPYLIKLPKNHVIQTEKKYSDKWVSRSISSEIFEIVLEKQSIDIISGIDRTVILIQNEDYGNLEIDIPLIINTLEFITATIIDRYAIEYRERGDYLKEFRYYHKRRSEILKGLPPLGISAGLSIDFTELFIKYYLYLKTNNHDQIVQTQTRIISAENTYITIYALALTTAIETILKTYFKGEQKKLEDDPSISKREIEKTLLSDSLKHKIISIINNLIGQVRADDILKGLINNGNIDKKFYTNWKKLRNSVNHGDSPTDDFQIYFDLCESCLVLYYGLILRLISYDGRYTDYSVYGHPFIKIK